MRKFICIMIMAAFAFMASAQNMTQLWQQVENANKKDLPREEMYKEDIFNYSRLFMCTY